jgi:hypothetical protein
LVVEGAADLREAQRLIAERAATLPAPAKPEVNPGPLEALRDDVRMLARVLFSAQVGEAYAISFCPDRDALDKISRGEVP